MRFSSIERSHLYGLVHRGLVHPGLPLLLQLILIWRGWEKCPWDLSCFVFSPKSESSCQTQKVGGKPGTVSPVEPDMSISLCVCMSVWVYVLCVDVHIHVCAHIAGSGVQMLTSAIFLSHSPPYLFNVYESFSFVRVCVCVRARARACSCAMCNAW